MSLSFAQLWTREGNVQYTDIDEISGLKAFFDHVKGNQAFEEFFGKGVDDALRDGLITSRAQRMQIHAMMRQVPFNTAAGRNIEAGIQNLLLNQGEDLPEQDARTEPT